MNSSTRAVGVSVGIVTMFMWFGAKGAEETHQMLWFTIYEGILTARQFTTNISKRSIL